MSQINSKLLCVLDAELDDPIFPIGATPEGTRMIANVTGGTVTGDRLSGSIVRSGADWLMVRADGTMRIDVRAALSTHDGHGIFVTYGGRLILPPETLALMGQPERLAAVDPSTYYFRTAPMFEAAMDGPYGWLNNIVSVGVGRLTAKGVSYEIHEIL